MKLVTRLWLSSALLPVLVMGVVLVGADRLFALGLGRSLDQALLAQAAIESVSLFDGPEQRPHLHMASSPLVESVRAFAPEGVLFGPDGREVMRYPPVVVEHGREEMMRPGTPGRPPVLVTRELDGARYRMLTVTVAAPAGEPYLLRLTASMAQVDAARATFRQLASVALVLVGLLLALVQTWQARTLKRRMTELTSHLEALRAGDLDRALPGETQRDELAALREVLANATLSLKQARDGKERLLADAAHELRTPLTLMRTNLDLALRKERSANELKTALAETREEVIRLALLASRLLDSAALAHEREPVEQRDLGELLRAAVAQAQPDAERRGLKLRVHAADPVSMAIRPQGLRQAIDNLLSNALKFAAHEITVDLARDGALVRITVSDDGPGIPAAEHEHVFEPFHRLHHDGTGAGLGLAIVREVARAHGGRALVQSTTRGACLVLELRDA